ncbi:hypothetical protein RHMOL_Rhmol02G0067600 [Rhododendron molle]|uniref:Uncharacterized protein n=1 Tax=Rhododendron molle TaxID=49168 RepID=A0ACC0PQH8_RHOML|nr:hypothetical protein RHMOL_Rhmol02G0067600 [Rhododendron molle]
MFRVRHMTQSSQYLNTHYPFSPLQPLAATSLTPLPFVHHHSPLPSTITALRRSSSISLSLTATGSFNHHGMQYSTTVPNDPDTHEDFRPTNKLEDSSLSLKDIVEQDIKENPVMIYIKGVPELPRCGFSSLAVRVLQEYNVPFSSRNILEDPELKDSVKACRGLVVLCVCGLVVTGMRVDWCCQIVREQFGFGGGKAEGGGWWLSRGKVKEEEKGSNWPTFPQTFIKGEFIGGSDIILSMHKVKSVGYRELNLEADILYVDPSTDRALCKVRLPEDYAGHVFKFCYNVPKFGQLGMKGIVKTEGVPVLKLKKHTKGFVEVSGSEVPEAQEGVCEG